MCSFILKSDLSYYVVISIQSQTQYYYYPFLRNEFASLSILSKTVLMEDFKSYQQNLYVLRLRRAFVGQVHSGPESRN